MLSLERGERSEIITTKVYCGVQVVSHIWSYSWLAVNRNPTIRSVGQNPKKKKIKKPVDLTSAYLAF